MRKHLLLPISMVIAYSSIVHVITALHGIQLQFSDGDEETLCN